MEREFAYEKNESLKEVPRAQIAESGRIQELSFILASLYLRIEDKKKGEPYKKDEKLELLITQLERENTDKYKEEEKIEYYNLLRSFL